MRLLFYRRGSAVELDRCYDSPMAAYQVKDLAKLGEAERDFIGSIEDEQQRDVVACSLIRHRLPDALAVGDQAPDLELQVLGKDEKHRLRAHVGERPTLLVFGSYT